MGVKVGRYEIKYSKLETLGNKLKINSHSDSILTFILDAKKYLYKYKKKNSDTHQKYFIYKNSIYRNNIFRNIKYMNSKGN